MDKVLNWGLLSTAHINRALIKPLRASKQTRLLGAASRSLANAEAYTREWNIPRAYGSYEAMLADPEIDIIYNSLPNHLHAEWTIKALRAGKHVLCEKPFALSLTEVDEVARASQETGKIAVEAFMYLHHAQTKKVQELVQNGVIGNLQFIRGSFSFTLTRTGNYRLIKEHGGGSLWDVGCYPVSYARTLIGAEPVEVFGSQVLGEGGCDETFYGQMRFENGIHAQFDCGFKSQFRSFLEIVGSTGSLQIPNPFKPGLKNEITLIQGDQVEIIKIKGQELYLGEVEDLCQATAGTPPRISIQDTRANIAVLLKLQESAFNGCVMPLG